MDMILIAALLPLLVEVAIWVIFYIRFDIIIIRKLAKNLKGLSDKMEKIYDCKKDNLLTLDRLLSKSAPICFIKKWNSMKYQIENIYTGTLIPEGENFFPFDSLIEIEGGRNRNAALWKCFLVFEALSVSLPVLAAFLFYPERNMFALGIGLGAFSLLAAGWLLFTLADESSFHKAEKEYNRFINNFNKIIPVTNKQSVLILEAIAKNQKTLETSTAKITNKFDGFAEVTVLPVLRESLKNISDLQENGMKKLASQFSSHLSDTLDLQIVSLSKTINAVQMDLSKLNENLSGNITNLNNLITTERNTLETAAQRLLLTGEAQQKVTAQIEELQKKSFLSNEKLNEQMEKMNETVDRLAQQNNVFGAQASDMIKQTVQTQLQIGNQIALSQDKIDAAVEESINQMDEIANKMKDSMATAGKEIALGIKETAGDNAEVIEKVAEQAKLLREDYDNYFSRIEEYSRSSNEEMEYHVQNVIASITEEVKKMLSDNIKVSQAVLEEYKDSNTSLLMAFKEQTNSISLYAKEINIDVNELSENLKTSVDTFNQSMQRSVESTIQEFDSGLAELSLRIANTVESICDAVEALPSAIGKK